MASGQDSLLDLERYRRQLESDIAGLKRGLQHWQTWDAEYEALKEEIEAAEGDDYDRIRNEFSLELIGRKEVDEVIGEEGKRTKDQMVNILDRRIDYVTRNISQLQKELQRVENKYATASVISQPDEAQDEEGQPITEILEELDEDDNVLSYKLNRPANNMSHVVEALRKAGVENVPEIPEAEPIKLPSAQGLPEAKPRPVSKPNTAGRSQPSKPNADGAPSKSGIPKKPPKKSVSFAEDTEPEDAEPLISRNAIRVENIMDSARQQTINDPVIPEDEDPEEAALRRDMLQYSMNEVGAVVGEMDLEEIDSDDEDWDMDDEGFDETESDMEDSYGRNGRVVTEDYAQRMLELERKLGIQSRFTRDSRQDTDGDAESGSDDERIGRIVVNHNPEKSSTPTATKTLPTRPKEKPSSEAKKGVRFADSLDVQEAPQAPQPVNDTVMERETKVEPMSDLVVERDPSTRNATTKPDRKPSRFKSAKPKIPDSTGETSGLDLGSKNTMESNVAERTPPGKRTPTVGPPDSTLADNLVERDYISMSMNEFTNVDEDEDMNGDVDLGELASRHQELRRKFIQQQGGFLKEDDNPIQPLDEEEGGPPRLSRFKAARLSKQ